MARRNRVSARNEERMLNFMVKLPVNFCSAPDLKWSRRFNSHTEARSRADPMEQHENNQSGNLDGLDKESTPIRPRRPARDGIS